MTKIVRLKNISKVRVDRGAGNDEICIISQAPAGETRIEMPLREFKALAAAITDAHQKITEKEIAAGQPYEGFIPDGAMSQVAKTTEFAGTQDGKYMIFRVTLNSGVVQYFHIPYEGVAQFAIALQKTAQKMLLANNM